MIIHSATAEDIRAIAQVHVETWKEAYRGVVPQPYLDSLSVDARESAWVEIFGRGTSELIIAKDFGTVVGFCSYGASRDKGAADNTGEVYAIYVAPSRWSTGAGRTLLQHASQVLKERGYSNIAVWVLSENDRAIRFYERAGFTRCLDSEVNIEIGGEEFIEVRYETAAA